MRICLLTVIEHSKRNCITGEVVEAGYRRLLSFLVDGAVTRLVKLTNNNSEVLFIPVMFSVHISLGRAEETSFHFCFVTGIFRF
jgi:hypothetical protein